MPKVPRTQRQEEVGGLPQIRQSAQAPIEAFGGGQAAENLSRAASGLAETSGKIYAEETERANNAWSTNYYNQLATKKQELYWDPKSGVIARKGSDSFSAPDEYGKMFDQFADEIGKDATPAQQAMAQGIRQKLRREFDGNVLKHVSSESLKYQDEAVKAGIQVARNDAVLDGVTAFAESGDLSVIREKIGLQEALYQQTAAGKSPALVELEMKDLRSQTHKAAIDRLLDNGGDMLAKDYFEKVKGEITGNDIDDVEKNLAAGNLAGESQRRSDSIFSKTGSLSQALDQARQIEDPKLRDETTRRVKDRYAMKKMEENEREDRLSMDAYNILDQTGDTDKIPRSMWNSFTGSQRSSLISYAKNKREGTQPEPNSDAYVDMTLMLANPQTRESMARSSITHLRGKVTDSEFKSLLNMQKGIISGDGKTKAALGGILSNAQVMRNTLKNAGIDADSDDGIAFQRKIIVKSEEFAATNGKTPTAGEVQDMVDGLLREVTAQKGPSLNLFGTKQQFWFDKKKKVFELDPGEGLIEVGDVPPVEREKITEYLKATNRPVTDANILKLYNLKIGGQ